MRSLLKFFLFRREQTNRQERVARTAAEFVVVLDIGQLGHVRAFVNPDVASLFGRLEFDGRVHDQILQGNFVGVLVPGFEIGVFPDNDLDAQLKVDGTNREAFARLHELGVAGEGWDKAFEGLDFDIEVFVFLISLVENAKLGFAGTKVNEDILCHGHGDHESGSQ